LLCRLQALYTYWPGTQLAQDAQPLCPCADVNVPVGQGLHDIEPLLGAKVPGGHALQALDPLLAAKVPGGQIEQPHKLALETPTFGLALYI